MKYIKVLKLNEADSFKYNKVYHNDSTYNYRIICKPILLKLYGKSASEIVEIFDVTVPTVYALIKYYKENGIKGLGICLDQGLFPFLQTGYYHLLVTTYY